MILITRPKAEAKKLKKIIEDFGYKVHVDSLSTMSFPKFQINQNFKGLILISSQRATKIFIENYSGPKSLPILVVGNVSYQKLISAGFSKILKKAKDSKQILKYLKTEYSQLKKKYKNNLTYLTGTITNKKFINDLEEIGFQIKKKIIYRITFKKSFKNSTVRLLNENKINTCLLYSQQNAFQFCEISKNKSYSKKCKKLMFLTLSQNISELMRKNGFDKVMSAKYPSQKSLINLLKRL